MLILQDAFRLEPQKSCRLARLSDKLKLDYNLDDWRISNTISGSDARTSCSATDQPISSQTAGGGGACNWFHSKQKEKPPGWNELALQCLLWSNWDIFSLSNHGCFSGRQPRGRSRDICTVAGLNLRRVALYWRLPSWIFKCIKVQRAQTSNGVKGNWRNRKRKKKVNMLRTRRHNLRLPDLLSWKDTPLCCKAKKNKKSVLKKQSITSSQSRDFFPHLWNHSPAQCCRHCSL